MGTIKKNVILVGLTTSGLCAYGLGFLKAYAYKYKAITDRYDIDILEFSYTEEVRIICHEIYKKRPVILGFTVHHGLESKVSNISKIIKNRINRVLIIWGGTEVSNNSEDILERNHSVDIIVRDEGEITFTEILMWHKLHKCSFENIRGITFKNKKRIVFTSARPTPKNLDQFPSPYLSGVFDLKKYRVIHMETYRGCPFKCKYCYEYRGFKDIRFFSQDRIKKELSFLLKSRVRRIKFFDATFTWGKKRIVEILEFLARNNKNTELQAETIGELLDEEIIRLMGMAGFTRLEIGIQTINANTLRNVGRTWDKKQFEKNIKLLLKYKITPLIHVMGGLPGDNLGDTKATINYVFSLGAVPELFLTKVLNGTQFEKIAPNFEIKFSSFGLHDVISNSTYSAEEVVRYKNIMKTHKYCKSMITAIPTLAKELKTTPADFYEHFSLWLRKIQDTLFLNLALLSRFLQKEYHVEATKKLKLIEFIRYCIDEFKAHDFIVLQPKEGHILYDYSKFNKYEFDFSNLDIFHPKSIDLSSIKLKKTKIFFVKKKRDIKRIII